MDEDNKGRFVGSLDFSDGEKSPDAGSNIDLPQIQPLKQDPVITAPDAVSQTPPIDISDSAESIQPAPIAEQAIASGDIFGDSNATLEAAMKPEPTRLNSQDPISVPTPFMFGQENLGETSGQINLTQNISRTEYLGFGRELSNRMGSYYTSFRKRYSELKAKAGKLIDEKNPFNKQVTTDAIFNAYAAPVNYVKKNKLKSAIGAILLTSISAVAYYQIKQDDAPATTVQVASAPSGTVARQPRTQNSAANQSQNPAAVNNSSSNTVTTPVNPANNPSNANSSTTSSANNSNNANLMNDFIEFQGVITPSKNLKQITEEQFVQAVRKKGITGAYQAITGETSSSGIYKNQIMDAIVTDMTKGVATSAIIPKNASDKVKSLDKNKDGLLDIINESSARSVYRKITGKNPIQPVSKGIKPAKKVQEKTNSESSLSNSNYDKEKTDDVNKQAVELDYAKINTVFTENKTNLAPNQTSGLDSLVSSYTPSKSQVRSARNAAIYSIVEYNIGILSEQRLSNGKTRLSYDNEAVSAIMESARAQGNAISEGHAKRLIRTYHREAKQSQYKAKNRKNA